MNYVFSNIVSTAFILFFIKMYDIHTIDDRTTIRIIKINTLNFKWIYFH